jgi:hypothetical protein
MTYNRMTYNMLQGKPRPSEEVNDQGPSTFERGEGELYPKFIQMAV